MGMADGYAQATGLPALINVHTAAGLGNAMGNLMTAFQNKTPLIVTAGQQTREMLLLEPFLTNIEATMLPRPWVKWSYEPALAEDVPAAFMRAFCHRLGSRRQGRCFLSAAGRLGQTRQGRGWPALGEHTGGAGPHPCALFRRYLFKSRSPVLVFGSGIVRRGGWDAAIKFAETVRAPVWAAPACERTPFPEDHPLYQASCRLPSGLWRRSSKDMIWCWSSAPPVFRYYPVPGG